jgi:DNA phosphorothioation-dependent restriction protein DptG
MECSHVYTPSKERRDILSLNEYKYSEQTASLTVYECTKRVYLQITDIFIQVRQRNGRLLDPVFSGTIGMGVRGVF